jgi:hypothetical protein
MQIPALAGGAAAAVSIAANATTALQREVKSRAQEVCRLIGLAGFIKIPPNCPLLLTGTWAQAKGVEMRPFETPEPLGYLAV